MWRASVGFQFVRRSTLRPFTIHSSWISRQMTMSTTVIMSTIMIMSTTVIMIQIMMMAIMQNILHERRARPPQAWVTPPWQKRILILTITIVISKIILTIVIINIITTTVTVRKHGGNIIVIPSILIILVSILVEIGASNRLKLSLKAYLHHTDHQTYRNRCLKPIKI